MQNFEFNLEDNLFQLHKDLVDRKYVHGAYHSFYVTDPKLRHIHKASVRDRVLHHAIFRVLYPVFDRTFVYDSYACRLGKGTHRAVDRLETFVPKISHNNHHNFWVLKCDIRKFFDSIDQPILRSLIIKRADDPNLHWLIDGILNSFSKSPGKGLPLGNVTSQLFANIYLSELDQFVKRELKVKFYLRYCDDFLLLHRDRERLVVWLDVIRRFLKEKLKLELHPNKITIRKYNQGIDFLGYVVLPHHRVLRTRTKRRILRKLARHAVSPETLQSYLGILNHCDGFELRKQVLHIAK